MTNCHASLPLAPVIGVYSFIPVGRGVKCVRRPQNESI